MRPTQAQALLGGFAFQQTVDEAGGKAVTTTNTIVHVELALRGNVRFAVDPGDSGPCVAVCGVDFTQGRRNDLHVGELLTDVVDHAEESGRVKL